MSFDTNNPAPVMQPAKKTTQVNIWMGVIVFIFLLLGVIAVVWYHHHREQAANDVDQKVNPTTSRQAQP
jgi:flagellar basal body-associated protein FliL